MLTMAFSQQHLLVTDYLTSKPWLNGKGAEGE